VAGLFYPEAARSLSEEIRTCLEPVRQPEPPPAKRAERGQHLKALIVPHAGYRYSGPIAGSAYRRLAAARDVIRRVVLLGPAHRVWIRGLGVPSAAAFATPLGTVDVDVEAVSQALALPQVHRSDAAHGMEHAIEVQLPFLQATLAAFRIVPFVVGEATSAEVAEVLDLLWGGPETIVLVSSDLSHYLPYEQARDADRSTATAILELSPTLEHEQACGATPINGLLRTARWRGLQAELVDLRNSGDTAGDRSRVVGYGSFAFDEPDAMAPRTAPSSRHE